MAAAAAVPIKEPVGEGAPESNGTTAAVPTPAPAPVAGQNFDSLVSILCMMSFSSMCWVQDFGFSSSFQSLVIEEKRPYCMVL